MGGDGEPLLVIVRAFLFRASARGAQNESSFLAAQAERTTTAHMLASGVPESPGQGLPGKPSLGVEDERDRRWRVRESGVIPGSS